jgi:sec-independent protein translocase protein TatA
MFGLQNIGTPEIIIVAVVLLIIFGPKKLPQLAKGIADAVKEIVAGFQDTKEMTKKTDKKKD